MRYRPLCLLVVLLLASVTFCIGQSVEGHVRTKTGQPIVGADVNGRKTDNKGYYASEIGVFLTTDTRGVVFATREGFLPKAIGVDLSTKKLDIVLDEEVVTDRVKAVGCGTNSKGLLGGVFRVRPPKGSKKKSGFDVDYGYFWISFGRSKEYWLNGMFDFTGGSNKPPNDFVISSTDIQVRIWQLKDGVTANDWSGRKADGTFWRHLGFIYLGGQMVEYQGASPEAKSYFNEIIDQGCVKFPY